jgi:hypothetical protein
MLTLATLGTVGLAPPVGASPPSNGPVCAGTVTSPEFLAPGVYSSLSMPPGSVCAITGAVTITHPLALGAASGLAVFSGPLPSGAIAFGSLVVTGAVDVGPNAFFGDAQGGVAPITVGGPLSVEPNGAVVIGSETPGGPLVSSVGGPVRGTDASTVQIHNSAIGGPVNLQGGGGSNAILDALAGGGYNFNDLEDNVISGPVTINSYAGIWAGVIRNQISGGLTFTNNTDMDEFDIGSNVIAGNANCSGNNPAVNTGGSPGSPNTVAGNNTCG